MFYFVFFHICSFSADVDILFWYRYKTGNLIFFFKFNLEAQYMYCDFWLMLLGWTIWTKSFLFIDQLCMQMHLCWGNTNDWNEHSILVLFCSRHCEKNMITDLLTRQTQRNGQVYLCKDNFISRNLSLKCEIVYLSLMVVFNKL